MATIADPDVPGRMIDDALLSALANRGFLRDDAGQLVDPEALEIMRHAVLAGKTLYLDSLGRLDRDWFAAHTVAIVIASPQLLRDVVWLLKEQPSELRDCAYRDIANIDPEMRAALIERINKEFEGEERARILTIVEGQGSSPRR